MPASLRNFPSGPNDLQVHDTYTSPEPADVDVRTQILYEHLGSRMVQWGEGVKLCFGVVLLYQDKDATFCIFKADIDPEY